MCTGSGLTAGVARVPLPCPESLVFGPTNAVLNISKFAGLICLCSTIRVKLSQVEIVSESTRFQRARDNVLTPVVHRDLDCNFADTGRDLRI
jgi:hypothetical protein